MYAHLHAHMHATGSGGRIGRALVSRAGESVSKSRSSQTNVLQNWYFSLPSKVLGIIRIRQALGVRIMWLSEELGHGTDGLVSQWGSTIKQQTNMHPCTLTNTHIHTHFHTLTFTLTHSRTLTHIYTHSHIHTFTHTHTYIHTHIYTGAHTCTHSHIHTRTLTQTLLLSPHFHTHTHSDSHKHTLTYIHTHTHGQTLTQTHTPTHTNSHNLAQPPLYRRMLYSFCYSRLPSNKSKIENYIHWFWEISVWILNRNQASLNIVEAPKHFQTSSGSEPSSASST